jgi:crotonobetainyl-CoA:carnitine CoA-transferase CaiB-like acyl-CoA transferase
MDLVHNDPQLEQSGFFNWLEHPSLGKALHFGWPIRLSESNYVVKRCPCMGEDTEWICEKLLGMSKKKIAELKGHTLI